MNILNPKKWHNLDNIPIRLQQLIESNEYIYVGNRGKNCSVVIENGKIRTNGISKRQKFYENIVSSFSDTTAFLGICNNNTLYVYDVLFLNGKDLRLVPMIDRIKNIKELIKQINHNDVVRANFYNINEKFYNYLGLLFEIGEDSITIFNKNSFYISSEEAIRLIDKSVVSILDGIVVGHEDFNENLLLPKDEVLDWEYWIDLRVGKKIKGFYGKDYLYGTKILEPISKKHYDSSIGAIIKLSNGQFLKIYSNKKINEKVRIGYIEHNNKIAHPFLLED